MYKIVTRDHAAWGIDGYKVPHHYFDHTKHGE